MINSKKAKILVELMHGMGDTVCALPMLKVLRMNFPDSEITVLIKFASTADIIEASHIAIDHIVCLDIYKDIGKSLSVLWKLRKSKFEYGISSCITPVRKANLFMKIVNPKHIVGWQKQHLFLIFSKINITSWKLTCFPFKKSAISLKGKCILRFILMK